MNMIQKPHHLLRAKAYMFMWAMSVYAPNPNRTFHLLEILVCVLYEKALQGTQLLPILLPPLLISLPSSQARWHVDL